MKVVLVVAVIAAWVNVEAAGVVYRHGNCRSSVESTSEVHLRAKRRDQYQEGRTVRMP